MNLGGYFVLIPSSLTAFLPSAVVDESQLCEVLAIERQMGVDIIEQQVLLKMCAPHSIRDQVLPLLFVTKVFGNVYSMI